MNIKKAVLATAIAAACLTGGIVGAAPAQAAKSYYQIKYYPSLDQCKAAYVSHSNAGYDTRAGCAYKLKPAYNGGPTSYGFGIMH
ncbi:hypothetical protein SAMN04489740_4271 [Arthrobacter alpinus]|uniref:Uncharacterized protein n=1 Tax=Arthrobacter alpinus TaxID=656366 RepID=A0A1H5PFN0_9MICC|nr:hypothetical protein [Arthrobacter alpinus]SEF12659.1 hypothetical protein SAMN04489740_4271 [Arthrobacter alpinus]